MVGITSYSVTIQFKKMQDWKAPGRDRVQVFWLTFGRMILCLKDPSKGNAVDNFRPNSCLPLTWKLMTGVIAEVMYEYLNEILAGEEEEKLED